LITQYIPSYLLQHTWRRRVKDCDVVVIKRRCRSERRCRHNRWGKARPIRWDGIWNKKVLLSLYQASDTNDI